MVIQKKKKKKNLFLNYRLLSRSTYHFEPVPTFCSTNSSIVFKKSFSPRFFKRKTKNSNPRQLFPHDQSWPNVGFQVSKIHDDFKYRFGSVRFGSVRSGGNTEWTHRLKLPASARYPFFWAERKIFTEYSESAQSMWSDVITLGVFR